jgi:hypothetical protein
MGAFSRVFKPRPGDFGEQLIQGTAAIGTGGRALTATATVSVQVPKPLRKVQVIGVAINGFTAAAGSGTITAQVFKVVGGNAGTRTALTAAFDLTTGGITTLDKTLVVPLSSGSDATNLLQAADALTVDIAAAGTVTTAPQAILTALMAVSGSN